MKTILAILLLVASISFGQNLAVKFYGTNPDNIPTNWPAQVRQIGTSTAVNPGESLMTLDQYKAYRAANQPAYDSWESAKVATEETRRATLRSDLRSNVSTLRNGLTNWATLTDTQKQNLLRVQIQTFLILGELDLLKTE